MKLKKQRVILIVDKDQKIYGKFNKEICLHKITKTKGALEKAFQTALFLKFGTVDITIAEGNSLPKKWYTVSSPKVCK